MATICPREKRAPNRAPGSRCFGERLLTWVQRLHQPQRNRQLPLPKQNPPAPGHPLDTHTHLLHRLCHCRICGRLVPRVSICLQGGVDSLLRQACLCIMRTYSPCQDQGTAAWSCSQLGPGSAGIFCSGPCAEVHVCPGVCPFLPSPQKLGWGSCVSTQRTYNWVPSEEATPVGGREPPSSPRPSLPGL